MAKTNSKHTLGRVYEYFVAASGRPGARTTTRGSSSTPAALFTLEGEKMILLEQHLVAKLSVGVDLFQKESHQVNQQFYAENITNREFAIAKESEFTP